MACLLLILALTFCEPGEAYLVNQHVDNSVGLYFREYRYQGKEIAILYQLAGTDLNDDAVETLPTPFMVVINGKPYMAVCVKATCWLQGY
jgi:hypothetical protein